MHAQRDIHVANLSVSQSVCLSHMHECTYRQTHSTVWSGRDDPRVFDRYRRYKIAVCLC